MFPLRARHLGFQASFNWKLQSGAIALALQRTLFELLKLNARLPHHSASTVADGQGHMGKLPPSAST